MIKRTQEDVFFASIERGLKITDACIMAGVSRDWYYDNLKSGSKKGQEFERRAEHARVKAKERCLVRVQNASIEKKHWQAAAWFLERVYPEEYALKGKYEHTIKGRMILNQRKTVDLSRLSDDALRKLATMGDRKEKNVKKTNGQKSD